jgi:PAS domain S-box-containing protein
MEPQKPLKILIVEDDPVFTEVMSQMLELHFGADIIVARDFPSAKEALLSGEFGLVTIDYMIPGGNGLELFSAIKDLNAPPPAIMVTGHGDERIASEAFQLGAAGYVVKDGRARALLPETIKAILEKEAFRKAHEESERMFRLLAENMSDNIWILDFNLNTIYTSPSIEKISGYTPEEAVSTPLSKTMTAESYDAAADMLLEEIRNEDSGGADPDRMRTIELEEYRKDGTTIWTESTVKFLRDEDGKAIAILGVSRDISDRKKILDDLKESEERFRIIAANVPGFLWTTDLRLRFTYVSPSVENMGYSVEETLALSLQQITTPESFKVASELLSSELEIADETAETAATVFELELRRKDGTTFRAEVSAGFLRDKYNKPYGLLGIAREIP